MCETENSRPQGKTYPASAAPLKHTGKTKKHNKNRNLQIMTVTPGFYELFRPASHRSIRWEQGIGRRAEIRGVYWSELGDMEGRVYRQQSRELEVDSRWV